MESRKKIQSSEVERMILTQEEAKALEKLLTCSKCGSKQVSITYRDGKYLKECLYCGYREELKGLEWD